MAGEGYGGGDGTLTGDGAINGEGAIRGEGAFSGEGVSNGEGAFRGEGASRGEGATVTVGVKVDVGVPVVYSNAPIEGGDFHEYRDGKLVRLRIVFDMARAMRQLGALPEPGTGAERLAVRLANLQRKLRRRS